MSIDRRQLLLGGLSLPWLGGASPRPGRSLNLNGDQSATGHRLRTGGFPEPASSEKTRVLILGAGVAGCSAAYGLEKLGFHDYRMLELGDDPGGNARNGRNGVSAFPLGAHYLPLPDGHHAELQSFLQDAGALTGWSAQGEAIYQEEFTCHDPEERVFYRGHWYEGLIPWKALPAAEIRDLRAFMAFVEQARLKKGRDGRRLFAIPLDESSRDSEWLRLDQITLEAFVRGQGWQGDYLAWYLDYCCRDDYGTSWTETSAWAGLHYFAARSGSTAEGGNVLTWPEGNAWLIRQLMRRSRDKFHGGSLVFRIQKEGQGFAVDSYQEALGVTRRWKAESLIVALPRFIAQRFLPEFQATGAMSYAPWMIANCTVDALPEGEGVPLSWDNVPYRSPSLGYVVATHQNLERYRTASVLSSYWPLVGPRSDVQRMLAGMRSMADWERLILADFEGMHPGISKAIREIDIWLWGHGMIQPKAGFIWGEARRKLQEGELSNLVFAHSDMSGISIFEEAFARGMSAARKILNSE